MMRFYWSEDGLVMFMDYTLEQAVWSESDLLELLGIDRKTLDYLRAEKGFQIYALPAYLVRRKLPTTHHSATSSYI